MPASAAVCGAEQAAMQRLLLLALDGGANCTPTFADSDTRPCYGGLLAMPLFTFGGFVCHTCRFLAAEIGFIMLSIWFALGGKLNLTCPCPVLGDLTAAAIPENIFLGWQVRAGRWPE
jgi:hypothetical protein